MSDPLNGATSLSVPSPTHRHHNAAPALLVDGAAHLLLFGVLLVLASCGPVVADGGGSYDAEQSISVEELRIGGKSNGFTSFGAPLSVAADGRVAVVDAAAAAVRVYNRDGSPGRVIGRQGDGPGEFRRISDVRLYSDRLWVVDQTKRRLAIYDSTGTLERETVLNPVAVQLSNGNSATVLAASFRPDGRLDGSLVSGAPISSPTNRFFTYPRVVFDSVGSGADTLGSAIFETGAAPEAVTVGGSTFGRPTVRDHPLYALASDGLYHIDRPLTTSASDAVFSVTRVGERGDTMFTRPIEYQPTPYGEEYREYLANTVVARLPATGSAVYEQVLQLITLPPYRLPVTGCFVDEQDRIWLETSVQSDAYSDWLVLDSDGSRLWSVRFPQGVAIRWAFEDIVWAWIKDEEDVPWVVRYRVQLSPATGGG